MRFDLLIKGGEIIDHSSGKHGKYDVAVRRDRIAAVDRDIPVKSAFNVIDATGQYVTPGLIDMHAHVYEGVTYWGINADAIGSNSGVTTFIDAGSAGAMTLQGFRDYIISSSKVKIFAFVNISTIGLTAQDYELTNPEYCNIALLERVVNLHRDIVVGIKLRAGRSGGAQDLLPHERARRAADLLELPIMMHISTAPPDLPTALGFLKPGDILTHCYSGQTMKQIDDNGKILPAAKKAWDDGILMDMGHGCGSLSFETAEALTGQGYWLDTISTDLHTPGIHGANLVDPLKGAGVREASNDEDAINIFYEYQGDGSPAFNLLTCIDKMLCVGMSFSDAIKCTTSRPAEILGMQDTIGSLKPGAIADIAGFEIQSGDLELVDIHGQIRHGKEHVVNKFTILDGRPFEPVKHPAPPPWIIPAGQAE